MGKVSVTLNGRAFTIGCEDGQEAYLRDLARRLDGHLNEIAGQVGQIGDLRLLLMASLVVVDELKEAETKIEQMTAQMDETAAQARSAGARSDDVRVRAAAAIDRAAARLEALVAEADA